MARVWRVGGKELWADQIPFAKGTDEYYRYVTLWRGQALGVQAGAPRGLSGGEWERRGDDDARNYWVNQLDYVKARDREGQDAEGYIKQAGQYYYDLNRNGVVDPSERAGKYDNPAMAADNRWDDQDGIDPRTDQQKFYDRDLSGWQQVADNEGRYHWYADWQYRDRDGSTQKKRLDLTYLGDRDGRDDAGRDIVGAGEKYARDSNAAWGGHDYWDYNDAPDQNWFTDQIRRRENRSLAARSGYTGYR